LIILLFTRRFSCENDWKAPSKRANVKKSNLNMALFVFNSYKATFSG
jgi:hypothetical protein